MSYVSGETIWDIVNAQMYGINSEIMEKELREEVAHSHSVKS